MMSNGEQGGPGPSEINSQQTEQKNEIEVPKVESENKRDEVLGKIENLLKEDDDEVWKQASEKLIADRVGELVAESEPVSISLLDKTSHKGFLHPDSDIYRTRMLNPFHIDDPEIYPTLLDTMREMRKGNWKDSTVREMAPTAVAFAVGKYFGNYIAVEDTVARNAKFHSDNGTIDRDFISLSEFRDQGFAVCAEKASVAQNMLSFLGYEVELVGSTGNQIANSDDSDTNDGHLYNIISSKNNHYIFDTTNPVEVTNKDNNLVFIQPATYKISEVEYDDLKVGGKVEVEHSNFRMENGQQIATTSKRIYAGPSKIGI